MRNFTETSSCCDFNFRASEKQAPLSITQLSVQYISGIELYKVERAKKMKNLILSILLVALGAVLPARTFAAVDPSVLEKQRNENKARLEKGVELRLGKPKKRLFSSSEVEVKTRSLKLDAIPPSPRRRTKAAPKKQESAILANPGRTISTTQSAQVQEGITTPKD